MKDYSVLLTCGESTMVVIHDAFDKGYQQGFEDGRIALCDCKDNMENEYIRGLNEAWEVIQNIVKDDTKGGYSYKMMMDIFGVYRTYDIVQKYAPQDAIRMIKEYEEQQKQDTIKVGDEVRNHDAIEVVTSVMTTGLQTIDASGNTSTWYYSTYPIETWEKTGRTFPQIAEVLAEMRGEKE